MFEKIEKLVGFFAMFRFMFSQAQKFTFYKESCNQYVG